MTINPSMILTLIGMSGVGKTFWAAKLAAHGFACFHCDELIGDKFQMEADPLGGSLLEIGDWMGLPYEAGFRQREARFMAYEADAIRDVIAHAAACAEQQTNCVIDTGGSAIYADAEIFQQLRNLSTIVYLGIPESAHQTMLGTYLANPRPLIWNGAFTRTSGESLDEAFARCYSQLIAHRERFYELYSDVKLEYSYHRQPSLTADNFLRSIQAGP